MKIVCFALAFGVVACSGTVELGKSDAGVVVDTGLSTPAACEIPVGPYGFKQGDAVDPNFAFDAYIIGGEEKVRTHSMNDFYDCDGSKGINAILIVQSEEGCPPCENEQRDMEPALKGGWAAEGVVIVVLMHVNNKGEPATLQTASNIRQAFGLVDVPVGVDTKFVFGEYPNLWAYPLNIVLDPRTLHVIEKHAGYSATPNALAQDSIINGLVLANKK